MTAYNMWLSVSKDMQDELKGWIDPGEGEDPQEPVLFPIIKDLSPTTLEFFRSSYDSDTVSRLFRTWTAAGRNYRVWSLYANKPDDVPMIKSDLDMMMLAYPQDFDVSGAWRFDDGRQVGDPPWYPNPPQLINFMPLVFTPGPGYPEDENDYTMEEPTTLTDVNVLAGQAPRVFDY